MTRRNATSEDDLFQAVYDDPDDDGARAVLADFLSERGDPRGELIALQLAAAKPGARRAALDARAGALVKKHQRKWLGPLAPAVKYLGAPKVGIADPGGVDVWWSRGFVAGGIVELTRPKLTALASAPEWATIERLFLFAPVIKPRDHAHANAVRRLLTSLRGLRRLVGTNLAVLGLAPTVPRLAERLERARLDARVADLPALAAHVGALRGLRELAVRLDLQDPPTFGPLLDLARERRLDALEIVTRAGTLRLERTAAGERLRVAGIQPEARPLVRELTARGVRASRLDDGPRQGPSAWR